jgi:hypothetical protein
MQTLKFARNSWHYKFIQETIGIDPYIEYDLCSYTRRFLFACLGAFAMLSILALVLLFILMMTYIVVHGLFYIAFCIIEGGMIFEGDDEPGTIGAGIIGFAVSTVALTGVGLLFRKIRNSVSKVELSRKIRNLVPKVELSDGFVKNAYLGWKNKFCAKVEFD